MWKWSDIASISAAAVTFTIKILDLPKILLKVCVGVKKVSIYNWGNQQWIILFWQSVSTVNHNILTKCVKISSFL